MLWRLYKQVTGQWMLILGVLAFIAYITNILIFYPGYLSNDSVGHLGRALGVYPVTDLSPPVMTALWRLLINVTGVTSSMLIFQLTMLWLALFLFSLYVFRVTKSRKLSLIPLSFGALPFVINISGVIWTDVQMTYALTLAIALVLYARCMKVGIWRTALLGMSMLLIIYACLVRYNAVLALIPIIFLVILEARLKLFAKRSSQVMAVAGVCLVIGVLFLGVNKIMGVQKSHPEAAIMLDDIVNVASVQNIQDALISSGLKKRFISIKKCTSEKGVLINNFWVCTTETDRRHFQFSHYQETKELWFQTVSGQPLQYVLYRTEIFATFLFTPESVAYIWQDGMAPNVLGQQVAFERAGNIVEIYVRHFGYKHFAFMFETWFWLLAAIIMLIYRNKARQHKLIIVVLCLSVVVYIIGYFPTGATGDYRYIYWPVLASLVSMLLLLVDRKASGNYIED